MHGNTRPLASLVSLSLLVAGCGDDGTASSAGGTTGGVATDPGGSTGDQKIVVLSSTLDPAQHPKATIINDRLDEQLTELRAQPGKDIWLFGGGRTFRSLLGIGQVDTIELAVIPVLLGGGIPFLPAPAERKLLQLSRHHVYPNSGIVSLTYDIVHHPKRARRKSAVAAQT